MERPEDTLEDIKVGDNTLDTKIFMSNFSVSGV